MTTDRESSRGESARPNPEVVAERVHDEVVVVHLGTNRIYALNRTAARAWELLAEGLDRTAIRERLRAEFVVDQVELDAELESFFATLASEGLVQAEGA